jgi:hypothetical protein
MTMETDITDLRKRVATLEDKIAYYELMESFKKIKFTVKEEKK